MQASAGGRVASLAQHEFDRRLGETAERGDFGLNGLGSRLAAPPLTGKGIHESLTIFRREGF